MAPTATVTSLFSQLVGTLKDEELIVAGPDIITFLTSLQSNAGDQVALMLGVHRLAASIMADQVEVKNAVVASAANVGISSLQTAIDAAKARQSGTAAPAAVAATAPAKP